VSNKQHAPLLRHFAQRRILDIRIRSRPLFEFTPAPLIMLRCATVATRAQCRSKDRNRTLELSNRADWKFTAAGSIYRLQDEA
jgi:hypothetical protein